MQPALQSRVETVKTTEVIGRPCIDDVDRPPIPRWPKIDAERAATQQLAAADEAYIARLELHALKADALLRKCATQPATAEGKTP